MPYAAAAAWEAARGLRPPTSLHPLSVRHVRRVPCHMHRGHCHLLPSFHRLLLGREGNLMIIKIKGAHEHENEISRCLMPAQHTFIESRSQN